jgi:hypothetical protein
LVGPGLLLAGAGEAGLVGEDDDLYPVTEVEFVKDPSDVSLHGALYHTQPLGDLSVGAAAGHLDEDLAFAVGELVYPFVCSRAAGGRVGQMAGERVDEPAGDARGDHGVRLPRPHGCR